MHFRGIRKLKQLDRLYNEGNVRTIFGDDFSSVNDLPSNAGELDNSYHNKMKEGARLNAS
jgi:hypothetical protein